MSFYLIAISSMMSLISQMMGISDISMVEQPDRVNVCCPLEKESSNALTFYGTIGKYEVVMTLQFNDNDTVTGSYYYKSQRAKGNKAVMLLKGKMYGHWMFDVALVKLNEYTESGNKTGTFDCELSGGTMTVSMLSDTGYKNLKTGKVFGVDLVAMVRDY